MPEDEDPFRKAQEDLKRMELGEELLEPDEIEARFQDLEKKHAEKRVELPSPDEFEERFKNLESRVGNTQQRRAEEKKQADRKLHSDAQAAKGAGVGLTIAYAILGLPMMGALIGYLIDKELGTNLWKGILTLIGAVIGVTFAVVVANRRA